MKCLLFYTIPLLLSVWVQTVLGATKDQNMEKHVFMVPNFHPASCGWLTDFSKERNYCANSYLDHLDRVVADSQYAFVLSEVNTMIAILNFQPERFAKIKRSIHEGRIEAVNAFFLEPTCCLSGGEALVKQGVEGIRWQRQHLGVTPRHAWMIDLTGMHEQMPQITAGLGLETLVHCRNNPSNSTIYWAQSPDGTRVLTVSSGHYNIWTSVFRTEGPLSHPELEELVQEVRSRQHHPHASRVKEIQTPDDLPYLVLAGSGDYSLAPRYAGYPGELLEQWQEVAPDLSLRCATFGDYMDAVLPLIRSGHVQLPTHSAGWDFSYRAFWIQNPRVKRRYRQSEHCLQATEMLAALASLKADLPYPSQDLYHAWLQMLLNMVRNTLWGAAGGMVFDHPTSWDAQDRFNWVDRVCTRVAGQAVKKLRQTGESWTLFNSANWERSDPVLLSFGKPVRLKGTPSQTILGGDILCQPRQPALGLLSLETEAMKDPPPENLALPSKIETDHYWAKVNSHTGDLISVILKPSGREILGGPANVLAAEVPKRRMNPGNHMLNRPERNRVTASNDHRAEITVTSGPLATRVQAESRFCGDKIARRIITFYHHHPRIDFDTYLEDVPDLTVVVAEFPLKETVTELRRGIPYGFSHGAWPEPTQELQGFTKGITPAVRWSAYTLSSGPLVALLDRGLPGRELNDRTPVVYLLNTTEKYNGYPNPWLSGKGPHHLQYALVASETPWDRARIPRLAWEYNAPPMLVPETASAPAESFVETSDNLIVQALRREGKEMELRLMEALGRPGQARITVHLPHTSARITDLLGKRPTPLSGGPTYAFPIRPQQIVTLRMDTKSGAPEIQTLTDWTPLVPESKRQALKKYNPSVKGHPPHG